jgi:hypothetical protein
LFGRVADRIGTIVEEALSHIGLTEDLVDLGIQRRHDLGRRRIASREM